MDQALADLVRVAGEKGTIVRIFMDGPLYCVNVGKFDGLDIKLEIAIQKLHQLLVR